MGAHDLDITRRTRCELSLQRVGFALAATVVIIVLTAAYLPVLRAVRRARQSRP